MTSEIFHQGAINTAITTAVGQDKSLVFFVTDSGELSNKWENVYLRNREVLPQLQKSSIILRLEEGSNEAAFLCAFCPAQKAPYISIVKNGALLATLPYTTTTQAQFTAAIHTTFPPAAASSPVANTPAALFAERKARLDALEGARKAQEKNERLARLAREKARREAESPARAKYVAEQKKIREDDIAEKQRILMLVENDKIERREKEKRKKQAQGIPVREKEEVKKPVGSGETAIAFRLLDGSVVKNTFPSESKLVDVRRWLDVNRTDFDAPYNFQQIMPNKELSASDENLSLTELEFSHATTLVLINKSLGVTAAVGGWNSE